MSEKENDRSDFENKLQAVLEKRFEGFEKLLLCRRLSAGASQETYRIVISTHTGKRQLAMRRSIKGVGSLLILGAAGLATEAKLFLRAKEAGVPEPEVFYVTAPEDGVGDAFIMEWLEGETLGSRIVRSESLKNIRPKLAYQCGQILARIHALDLEETGLGKRLVRINPEDAIDMGWNRYKSFKTAQPTIDYTARWLKEHLPESSRTTLVHGDFRNGNLIVSPLGVIAVLDWEAAHVGDPMRDLGWLCTNSWRFGLSDLPVGGFGDYNDLFRGYEDESGLTIDPDHVKFWEVFGSFLWAGGCLGMAEIFRSGVDNSVERPAIGRRTSECQVDCVNLLIPGPVKLVRKKNRDEISS
ncbi:MAG: phosphotransferase family protein, partial [Deltaproteobacteria bacterium]|nr:phosphotransferase family protein [Deltaproteobacteria bacterium]